MQLKKLSLSFIVALSSSFSYVTPTFAESNLLANPPKANAQNQLLNQSTDNSGLFSSPKTLLSGKQKNKPQFLSATQAFKFSAIQSGENIIIAAKVTPAHYLYQQRFSVQGSTGLKLGKISYDQQPEFEEDPEFGRVPVFHHNLTLTIPAQGSGTLSLNWQGCAKAGVCYPPEQFQTKVLAVASSEKAKPQADESSSKVKTDPANNKQKETLDKTTNKSEEVGTQKTKSETQQAKPESSADKKDEPVKNSSLATMKDVAKNPSNKVKVIALGDEPVITSAPLPDNKSDSLVADEFGVLVDDTKIKNTQVKNTQADLNNTSTLNSVDPANSMISDPFGLADNTLLALALLFLAGLGLAFTPCVLPMLPIVANLVAAQHRRSAGHGFLLASAYAVGVACSYAMLGALITLFGHQINLIAWSQHPAVLISFAAIFVLLALHTFDLFELRLPVFIRSKIEKLGEYGQAAKWSGSIFGCWVAGFFSALIVSPCLSAPLAGVLLSVSTVGDPWLGALALFCLGIGLGVPLMILGATEGKFLPKAGNWLNWVRRGFGLLLFGVALVLLNRVFDAPWMLLLWAVLVLVFAFWLWYWAGRGSMLTKVLSMIAGLWAVLLVVGASVGATDPIRPLAPLTAKLIAAETAPASVATIYNLAQLQQYQQQYPYLLVELSADWCISCKIVERELFLKKPVPELQQWTRIKLDVTKTTVDSRSVLKAMNVFGPPAILLFKQGQQVEQLLGEPSREEFQAALQQYKP